MFEIINYLNKIIELFVSCVTLGLFKDIVNILPKSDSPASLALAWAVTVARYAIVGFIIYAVTRRYIGRYAILATAIAVVAMVLVTQPWTTVNEVAERFGGLDAVMKDYSLTRYSPSLLKVGYINNSLNLAYNYTESLEKAVVSAKNASYIKINVPHIENNTLTFRTVSLEWIFYLITLVAIFLVFYILKHLNKYIAVIVASSLFAMFFLGISTRLIFDIALVLALILAAWYVFKFAKVLAIYPIVVAVMLLLSLVELPKFYLFITLVALMYLTLIPVFYAVGIAVAEIGEVIERRDKFGMKVKPKKVIEERAGVWDKFAVAVILSAVFLIAIVLFGANIYGLMTFIGIVASLFRS